MSVFCACEMKIMYKALFFIIIIFFISVLSEVIRSSPLRPQPCNTFFGNNKKKALIWQKLCVYLSR